MDNVHVSQSSLNYGEDITKLHYDSSSISEPTKNVSDEVSNTTAFEPGSPSTMGGIDADLEPGLG